MGKYLQNCIVHIKCLPIYHKTESQFNYGKYFAIF